MKNLSIIALTAMAVLLTAGCASLRQTPEEKERIAELVNQRLDQRQFRIDIDYMSPRRGSGQAVSYSYSLTAEAGRRSVIHTH